MNKFLYASALVLTLFLAACQQQTSNTAEADKAAEPSQLETDEQQNAYALGAIMGQNLSEWSQLGMEIDRELAIKGFTDALDDKVLLDESQLRDKMQAMFAEAQKLQMEKNAKQGEENLKKGQDYLAENGQREGVTTTDSGLQYEVLTAAEGAKPAATDTVTVHYRGTLLDGTEFDSSYARNQPASFPLNGVIKGWTEGLQLMSTGSKFKFFIPADLAYGPQGRPSIPANATLIFEVELLEIAGSEEE